MANLLYTQHYELFLNLLRDRREELGMRQTELAHKLRQSQASISRVEAGERRIDVIELRDWLRALQLEFLPFMTTLEAKLRETTTIHEIRLGQDFSRDQQ